MENWQKDFITEYASEVRTHTKEYQQKRENEIIHMTEKDVINFINKREPLTVSVNRPNSKINFADDYYKLQGAKKGMVLVINITEFDNKSRNRKGAKKDKNYMNDLWSDLGYNFIRSHEGYITKDMLEIYLEEFRIEVETQKPKSIVVFVGSRGKYYHVETSDGQFAHVLSQIVYKFNSEICEVLKGIPKIFLISTCNEFLTYKQKTSFDNNLALPMDDAFLLYAVTPECLSRTDNDLGSWFAYCFTKVVMENAHNTDFKTLVDLTQKAMKTINGVPVDGFGLICSLSQPASFATLYFNLDPYKSLN